jgi:hypothetical protein
MVNFEHSNVHRKTETIPANRVSGGRTTADHSRTPHQAGFLQKSGITLPAHLNSDQFRKGGWPGNCRTRRGSRRWAQSGSGVTE